MCSYCQEYYELCFCFFFRLDSKEKKTLLSPPPEREVGFDL